MEEVPIIGSDGSGLPLKYLMSQYGGPAFMRRANQVQEALDQLVNQCRRERDEMLKMVKIHLGALHGLAGDWNALRGCLEEDELRRVQEMHADLAPQPRLPITATTSARVLRRALRELIESIEWFNRRWQQHLAEVDLGGVNEVRDEYNRYYVLEKECLVRSPRLARQGFRPLEPLTLNELTQLLPPLPVPRLKPN